MSGNVRRNLAVQLVADGENPLRLQLRPNPSILPMRIGQTIGIGMLALAAQGGVGPYAYSIIAGSLPAGLELDGPSGRITGTIAAVTDSAGDTNAGFHGFVAQVEDADTTIFRDSFSIHVDHILQPDQVQPQDIDFGFSTYKYQFTVKNATGAVTYTHTTLPTGVSITSGGLLSVNSSLVADADADVTFTLTADDAGTGDSIDIPVTFHIYPFISLNWSLFENPINTPIGTPTAVDLVAALSPTGFKPPYIFSLFDDGSGGALPDWITLDRNGLLTINPPISITALTQQRVRFLIRDQLYGFTRPSINFTFVNPNTQLTILDRFGTSVSTNPGQIHFGAGLETFVDSNGDTHVIAIGGDSGGPFGSPIPYFTGIPPSGAVGTPYSFTPTLNNPGTSNAFGLMEENTAAFASIDPTTGVISGTPVTGGAFVLAFYGSIEAGTLAGATAVGIHPINIASLTGFYAALVGINGTGPTAWYKLDEASGDFIDQTGGGLDLTPGTGLTRAQASLLPSEPGSGCVVSAGTGPIASRSAGQWWAYGSSVDFSIGCVIDITLPPSYSCLIRQGNSSNSGQQGDAFDVSASGQLALGVYAGGFQSDITAAGVLSSGLHLAGLTMTSGGQIDYWVDGSSVHTTTGWTFGTGTSTVAGALALGIDTPGPGLYAGGMQGKFTFDGYPADLTDWATLQAAR